MWSTVSEGMPHPVSSTDRRRNFPGKTSWYPDAKSESSSTSARRMFSIPPFSCMAWAAFVHRFIITWWICVGSAITVALDFRSWRISIVAGNDALRNLIHSFIRGSTRIGFDSNSLWRLKVRICFVNSFPLNPALSRLFKLPCKSECFGASSSEISV